MPSLPQPPRTNHEIFAKGLDELVNGAEQANSQIVPELFAQHTWLSNNVTRHRFAQLSSRREELIRQILSGAKKRDAELVFSIALRLLELTETINLLTQTTNDTQTPK
jgi:hypothetical protein